MTRLSIVKTVDMLIQHNKELQDIATQLRKRVDQIEDDSIKHQHKCLMNTLLVYVESASKHVETSTQTAIEALNCRD